ncbi:Uncharacterised protein [Mycobacteroides abscessus subsp. abscessus]|nr:Uncharacterised protein [Mycobacteroides abscessus subsp. abscessus]SHW01689.1 Uncharacterised protein [Mycobacteroides abscessus subsp. abscessus]SKP10469.1 Uncharacterised protein [Mycobacteroides abscessus subsp. abscessus]
MLLSGNGNHEAKYAGLTQGSQRMLPAAVSMKNPAWPTLVTRMAPSLSSCDFGSQSADGRVGPLFVCRNPLDEDQMLSEAT